MKTFLAALAAAMLSAASSGQTPPSDRNIVVTDIGDIQPADPGKFYKEPGYSPYAGKHYPPRQPGFTHFPGTMSLRRAARN